MFNVPQLQGSSVRPGGPWRQGVLCGLDGERGKAACSHNVHSRFSCKSRYSIQTIGILGITCLRGSFSPSPADAERRRRQQAVHLQILWQPHGRRGVGPPPTPTPPRGQTDSRRPHPPSAVLYICKRQRRVALDYFCTVQSLSPCFVQHRHCCFHPPTHFYSFIPLAMSLTVFLLDKKIIN